MLGECDEQWHWEPDPTSKSRAVRIRTHLRYYSTHFTDSAHGARLFGLKEFGNMYSPHSRRRSLRKVSLLSKEAWPPSPPPLVKEPTQFIAITTLAHAGDNIVSTSNLYGGTCNQSKVFLPRLGIKDQAVYVESIGNPRYNVPDLEAIAEVAHDKGAPLVVDNTFGAGG
ncbi:hypothetical protein C2857_006371 [Epichloe festucae Fl1]|uniref:Uncharacterized protein n=1 Tax=Epichloe festucae (strain Fl1) TaxID=877507 RepID=A0A7S9KQ12_EPIFF|nr:hypothetical protein C2857_006371 [Epichloe festucae Fl1]